MRRQRPANGVHQVLARMLNRSKRVVVRREVRVDQPMRHAASWRCCCCSRWSRWSRIATSTSSWSPRRTLIAVCHESRGATTAIRIVVTARRSGCGLITTIHNDINSYSVVSIRQEKVCWADDGRTHLFSHTTGACVSVNRSHAGQNVL